MRHEDQWILIEGPFETLENDNNPEISVFWPDFYDLHKCHFLRGKSVHRLNHAQMVSLTENYLHTHNLLGQKILGKAPWLEPIRGDFSTAFDIVLEKIKKGEIQKAVPAVFARTIQRVSDQDRALMIYFLLQAPAPLFVYGFWQKGQGVLGATPEILFEYQQGVLKTMALAGTLSKSGNLLNLDEDETVGSQSQKQTLQDVLLSDPKERQEHQYVVEDLQSRLADWGNVTTLGPSVLDLPMLCHLKTDLEVRCHSKPDFKNLIQQLHPTPALGVAPRSAGYSWMADFSGQEGRAGFGSPFAFIEKDKAVCLVAIRNLQWNENEALIGSGCGVVAASDLEREWKELFHKRLSVKKILGLEA